MGSGGAGNGNLGADVRGLTRGERLARAFEARGGKGGSTPKAPVVEIGPCPDPDDPKASSALYGAAFRRCWAILAHPDTTPQDVISLLATTRLAARVGQDKPVEKRVRLKTESILPPVDEKPTPGG